MEKGETRWHWWVSEMHTWAPPQPGGSPQRGYQSRGRDPQGSRPPGRLGIPGRPEVEADAEAEAGCGEGVSYYTCQAAANTRPRNRRDSVTEGGKSVTRPPRDQSSASLLVFALILLKQRQSTSTAIFLLPQKPPLRQTLVSSFSAMPPASARWEMRAGETGGTRASTSPIPSVQKTTTPRMPRKSRPLFRLAYWSRGWSCKTERQEWDETRALWLAEAGPFVRLLQLQPVGGAWSTDFFFFFFKELE